jgi:hypothetical protein
MEKTYAGSCHCGKVRYEAEIDLAAGTGKCNCTYCAKVRNWSAMVKPEAFRLLSGENDMGTYRFGSKSVEHVFCKHCGVRTFTRGHIEAIGGDFVSVSLATLDNARPAELAEAPVWYSDGLNNDWLSRPAETRHL